MAIEKCYIVPHPPMILPEIGKGEEMKIQKTQKAYREIAREIAEIKPDTVIIATPHAAAFADYIHIAPGSRASGSFKDFRAPEVAIEKEYDTVLVEAICSNVREMGVSAGTMGERNASLDHGTMIPLYFIDQYYKEYQIVRCSLSGLSPAEHYRFGKCIQKACQQANKKAVFIASGDLSHRLTEEGPYGYAPEGAEFDRQAIDIMASGEFMGFMKFSHSFCDKAGECGLGSFLIMAGVLDQKAVIPKLYSYEGPFGVGYAVASYTIAKNDPSRQFDLQYMEWDREERQKRREAEDVFVKLARSALECVVLTGQKIKRPAELPEELTKTQAGVFVSLKKDGMLRGCIGTIDPVDDCIADEIINNAISAGMRDPRFDPVEPEELPYLIYSVDVLQAPEPIQSIEELDVERYGLIVTAGEKRGLLLPSLEGVETPEKQVAIALEKGEILPDEPYTMERFQVVRHG